MSAIDQIRELLLILALISTPLGVWLFQKVILKWTEEVDPKKRESLSRTWHAISYWVMVIPTIALFYFSGYTQWFVYLPLMMVISMILYDLWWNWRNRSKIGSNWLVYAGNGKGGFIEVTVYSIYKFLVKIKVLRKMGMSFPVTMLIVKIILLAISVIIIIKFK